jgi:uncharacterized protein YceH (UPF0502 family)
MKKPNPVMNHSKFGTGRAPWIRLKCGASSDKLESVTGGHRPAVEFCEVEFREAESRGVEFDEKEPLTMETLNPVEVRVLGSLMEKEVTTPEYYPLTLNALTNACNQISNRDPVVSFDERTVVRAIESLREKQLVWMVTGSGRVPKYEHRLAAALSLAAQEAAVLCVLMLRGPQTAGEIRGRTGRLYEFQELSEVELTLQALMAAQPQPLVTRLPRQAGMKEPRYAHLLSGEVQVEEHEPAPRREAAALEVQAENERIARLEGAVETLSQGLAELKQQFLDFKKQFE